MATTLSVDPQHLKGRHVDRAVEVLRRSGVIVYPTDTIYGLGCDVASKAAVERIRRIKGRDADKPMSFVCSDLVQISRYGHVSNFVHRILKRFLPGPYTFVLTATRETPRVLQSKQKTVGVRMPDHPVPLALVERLGNPVVSTSANESNEVVVTNPADLERIFGNRVDLIMECGTLPVQASSVVSLVDDTVEILREGQGDLSYFRSRMA